MSVSPIIDHIYERCKRSLFFTKPLLLLLDVLGKLQGKYVLVRLSLGDGIT